MNRDGRVGDLCPETDRQVLENHEKLVERERLYLKYGYDYEKERTRILEKAGTFSGKILEAGTGKGYFAITLARKECRFTSFDISREEQEIARLNLKYHGLDHLACLRVENGEKLSFKNKSFATIFSVNTLHHLASPFQVIDELIRVLSLKGKLVLSDFNEKGFAIMDAIHAAEGRIHERGTCGIAGVVPYLEAREFKVKKSETDAQSILVASRRP